MSFIRFEDVTKIYQQGEVEIHALDGISFSIVKGSITIIAGASGAGKSTVLNILGGMDTATSGIVEADGVRVDQMNERQLTDYRRYDIGFVFQFYNLVQNLTALENVELASEICRNPLDPARTLEQVGLKDRMNNKQILKLLQNTVRMTGMTVVIITHNLAICPMGDRVISLRSGRVVSDEVNPHPEDISEIEW